MNLREALEKANRLEAEIKRLQEKQDAILEPHYKILVRYLTTRDDDQVEAIERVEGVIEKMPHGFYRTELQTLINQLKGVPNA